MQFIENSIVSIGDAVRLFTESVGFTLDLVAYLPSVLGTAVVVFLAAYIIRFCLLK